MRVKKVYLCLMLTLLCKTQVWLLIRHSFQFQFSIKKLFLLICCKHWYKKLVPNETRGRKYLSGSI